MKIKTLRQLQKLSTEKSYYLASPYSHKHDFTRQLRYEAINYVGARLALLEYMILEPIGSCHDKSLKYEMPTGYEFWQKRDRKMIEITDGIIVTTLPGWEKSVGVTDEIEYAKSLGKDLIYLDPAVFLPNLEEIFSLPIAKEKA